MYDLMSVEPQPHDDDDDNHNRNDNHNQNENDNKNNCEQTREHQVNNELDDTQEIDEKNEGNTSKELDNYKKIRKEIRAIDKNIHDVKSELMCVKEGVNSMNGEIQSLKKMIEQFLSSPHHYIPSSTQMIPISAPTSSLFSFFTKSNNKNTNQQYINNHNINNNCGNNYNAHGTVAQQRRTVKMGYFVHNGESGLQRAVEETLRRVKGMSGDSNFEFYSVTPPSSKFLYFRRIADKRNKVYFDDLFSDSSFLSSIQDANSAIVFMVHTTKDSKEEFNMSKYTNNPCFILKYFEQNANSLLNIADNSTQLQAIAQYISR